MREIWLVYPDRKPPDDVRQAFSGQPYRVDEVSYRKLVDLLGTRVPDAVVVTVESQKSVKNQQEWILKAVKRIKNVDENLPIIAVVSPKSVSDAVDLMKAGVYDCFDIPVDKGRILHSVENGIKLYDLMKRVYLLESESTGAQKLDDIVGRTQEMRDVFQLIKVVGKSAATALILGESGTGKELVAQAIHRHSPRARKPFVDINCGAIPHELLENELFGHEKGSFTGADKRYIGSFERADGGSVFLDEISEMPLALQVKLLRFLQERTITRVGGMTPIKLDVRIIAATNRNLEEEVREGRFREDLYYRLNVVPINIPPLRNRREDIPLLAQHFLKKYSEKNERIFIDISPQALDALVNYDWPGNVRELENVIERIVVLNNDSRVKQSHLPPVVLENRGEDIPEVSLSAPGESILPLEQVERYAIEDALHKCMGNIAEAARKLNIGQATLYRKIRKYGLRG